MTVQVPRRYQHCTLESFRGVPKQLEGWAAREQGDQPNVVLWGPTGTGKTHLATALLRAAAEFSMRPDERVIWRSTRGFLEQLKAEFGTDREVGCMDRMIGADAVLLDDLGAELLSGDRGRWRLDRVSYLVAERHDLCAPTIVTTNLTPEQLNGLDARMASRLLSGIQVPMRGDDRRFEVRA